VRAVLNVSGYSEGSQTFDLLVKLKYTSMPSNIRVTSVNPGTILLDIIKDPQRIITRIFQIQIREVGESSTKYKYTYSDSVCSVTVRGKSSDVNRIQKLISSAKIDVSGLGVGTWNVNVDFWKGQSDNDPDWQITDYSPKTVRVTVKVQDWKR